MADFNDILKWAESQGLIAANNTNGQSEPKPLWAYPFTDLGNAERLHELYAEKLLYCWAWGKWLAWDEKRWNVNMPEMAYRCAALTVRAMYQAASELANAASALESEQQRIKAAEIAATLLGWARKSEARSRIDGMIALAREQFTVGVTTLDSNADLFNCQNGTVMLSSGELRPHDPANYITKLAAAAYSPLSESSLWLNFIETALPDVETREYTQKLAGYTLSGSPDHDVVILFHGPGGTGKSTFLESFRATLGDYAAAADIGTFTNKRDPHAPQPDLARLAGKRLVTIPEAQEAGGIVSLLKAVSGGDAITTRSHHQESFDLDPTFTLWLRANKRPRVPDDDSGLWRRLKEIPWAHRFEQPDETIRKQLKNPSAAGAEVLAWAVQGYQKLMAEGLTPPTTVLSATADYRREMDPLADWLEDQCLVRDDVWSATKDLLADYKSYATESGYHPIGPKAFSQRLGQAFTAHKTNKA